MIHSPRCVSGTERLYRIAVFPEEERYVFAYTVTIRNLGRSQVQLLGRYWLITNGHGRETEVQGEGWSASNRIFPPAVNINIPAAQ